MSQDKSDPNYNLGGRDSSVEEETPVENVEENPLLPKTKKKSPLSKIPELLKKLIPGRKTRSSSGDTPSSTLDESGCSKTPEVPSERENSPPVFPPPMKKQKSEEDEAKTEAQTSRTISSGDGSLSSANQPGCSNVAGDKVPTKSPKLSPRQKLASRIASMTSPFKRKRDGDSADEVKFVADEREETEEDHDVIQQGVGDVFKDAAKSVAHSVVPPPKSSRALDKIINTQVVGACTSRQDLPPQHVLDFPPDEDIGGIDEDMQ